ncbi:MAG: sigma-70 family RNA polymerase sigma factor [Cellvibrionaceae bacterium]
MDIEWSAQVDQLLYRIQRRDKLALKALYDIAGTKLLAIVGRIVRDVHEAEDVLQDVFVKIWQQSEKYSGAGSAWGWLCALTRNAALDRLRSLSAHPHISTDEESHILQGLFAEQNLSDSHSIKRCLSGLKEQPRKTILLSFVYGYTHGELVEQMATPLGTIKAWIRRGLQELKQCLSS